MPRKANEKLVDAFLLHTVDLMRVGEGIRGEILLMLQDLGRDLQRQLDDASLGKKTLTPYMQKRINALIKQTNSTIATAYRQANRSLAEHLLEVGVYAQTTAVALIASVFGKEVTAKVASVALTMQDMKQLTSDVMIQGAPSSEWWAKQSRDTMMRFRREVQMGIAQGETNDQIVSRILGNPTGRRTVISLPSGKTRILYERDAGILNISKREATALVRTSILTVSNAVHEAVYQENQDILQGRALHVTLDSRTTPICRSRSGGAWNFNGDPLPQSRIQIPFPGPPPYHYNCRSILIPIVKSWNELANLDIPGLDNVSTGTQSSMDGQVPGNLNYEDWLKTKSESFQKQVMGEGRYDLWKSGQIKMADLVDQSGRALTLAELRNL